MDPYQQNQGGPQPPQGNPYEFILNPEKNKPKRRLGLGSGKNRLVMLLIFIVSGVVIFMILVTVLLNAFAPEKIGKAEFMSLAQTQNELIRISGQASGVARQQVTKNLATTIQYTMKTQQNKVVSAIGEKVGRKELSLKQKATSDQQLASAKQTSTYDKTFTKLIGTELTSYANEVRTLFDKAATDKDRDLMSDFYAQTQLLIAQVPYTEDGIDAAGQ
jgi:hypothetical protein